MICHRKERRKLTKYDVTIPYLQALVMNEENKKQNIEPKKKRKKRRK